jgi:hypothetical protein
VIRYYLGRPVTVASALEGWVLGYWPDGREFTFWHAQLHKTPWGDAP